MRIERWNQRRRIALLPAPIRFGEDGCAVLLHLSDESIGYASFFVIAGPDEQLKQYRSERNAFRREAIVRAAAVFFSRLGGQDARILKFAKSIREDVR